MDEELALARKTGGPAGAIVARDPIHDRGRGEPTMPAGAKVLKRRFVRPAAVATPFTITSHGDPDRQEPSPDGSRATGQLIDMGEWRLLPPVDSDLDGAA